MFCILVVVWFMMHMCINRFTANKNHSSVSGQRDGNKTQEKNGVQCSEIANCLR